MSLLKDYLPKSLAELVTWSNNFDTVFTSIATSVGGTAAQATAFHTLNLAWTTSYSVAENDLTRSPANIITRNAARKAMIANARMLVRIIQAYPGTTDAQRVQLGITVRDSQPSPIPPLTTTPIVEIDSVVGRLVRFRIKNPDLTTKRALPRGVKGVNLYTFVGQNCPEDPSEFQYQGLTSRALTEVLFASSVPSGATIWVSACWVGSRGELGIGSPAFSFTLQGGNTAAGRQAA